MDKIIIIMIIIPSQLTTMLNEMLAYFYISSMLRLWHFKTPTTCNRWHVDTAPKQCAK